MGKIKRIALMQKEILDTKLISQKYVIKEYDLLNLKLGESRGDMDKGLWMSEFRKYFRDDIKEFLRLVKVKIEELEKEQKSDGMD